MRFAPALSAAVLAGCWLCTRVADLGAERVALEHDLPGILLFYYNWCEVLQPPRSPLRCAHLWSLSVEEQFYFLWPGLLVILLAWQLRRRWILAVALVGLVVPPLLRLTWFGLPHAYYGTDSRMDALAAGCITGLFSGWGMALGSCRRQRLLKMAAWVAAVVLLGHPGGFPYPGHYASYAGHAFCTLSTMTLIAALVWSPPRFLTLLLAWSPLRWVGHISYGAYLWHLPVLFVVVRFWGPSWAQAWGLLLVVLALVLGAASYYLLERPFLSLKGRLNRLGFALTACGNLNESWRVEFPGLGASGHDLTLFLDRLLEPVAHESDTFINF